jgi:hypothetical protein
MEAIAAAEDSKQREQVKRQGRQHHESSLSWYDTEAIR